MRRDALCHASHAVLVVGALCLGLLAFEQSRPSDKSPEPAAVSTARRSSTPADGAFAHFKEGDQWLKDNLYLCMASPCTELGQGDLGQYARHEFYLTILFGSFEK